MPRVPAHNHRPRGYRIDLHKYIGGKHIVGINQGKQGSQHQVNHGKIKVLLCFFHLKVNIVLPSKHRQKHNGAEEHCKQCLQGTDTYLIAKGCRKMPHRVGVLPVFRHKTQYKGIHNTRHPNQNQA